MKKLIGLMALAILIGCSNPFGVDRPDYSTGIRVIITCYVPIMDHFFLEEFRFDNDTPLDSVLYPDSNDSCYIDLYDAFADSVYGEVRFGGDLQPDYSDLNVEIFYNGELVYEKYWLNVSHYIVFEYKAD